MRWPSLWGLLSYGPGHVLRHTGAINLSLKLYMELLAKDGRIKVTDTGDELEITIKRKIPAYVWLAWLLVCHIHFSLLISEIREDGWFDVGGLEPGEWTILRHSMAFFVSFILCYFVLSFRKLRVKATYETLQISAPRFNNGEIPEYNVKYPMKLVDNLSVYYNPSISNIYMIFPFLRHDYRYGFEFKYDSAWHSFHLFMKEDEAENLVASIIGRFLVEANPSYSYIKRKHERDLLKRKP